MLARRANLLVVSVVVAGAVVVFCALSDVGAGGGCCTRPLFVLFCGEVLLLNGCAVAAVCFSWPGRPLMLPWGGTPGSDCCSAGGFCDFQVSPGASR